MNYIMQKLNLNVASILETASIAIILGLLTTTCSELMSGIGSIAASPLVFIGKIALTSIIFVVCLLAFNHIVKICNQAKPKSVSKNRIGRFVPKLAWKSIALFSLALFAFWTPWILAVFPGAMNWDTFFQIYQCYPGNHPIMLNPWYLTESYIDNYFTDHHPIFDTFVFGAFACASDFLFGSWNIGVFAFILIQALGTACAFVVAIAYVSRLGCPSPLCIGIFLFFAILPVYPVYSATMLKDSFFSWFFIPWFIQLVEICRTKGVSLSEKRFFIAFFALSLLLCLTKKTGLYIAVFTLVVFAIIFRKHWKKIAAVILSCIVLMQLLLPLVVFRVFDVAPGGKQESFAPLFQQTARYVVDHPDDVQDWERVAIDNVLYFDTLQERYDPTTADPVKNEYNWREGDQYLGEYLKAWISMGLRHPDAYIKATLSTASPYFSPGGFLELHEYTGDVEHGGSYKVWQPRILEGYRAFMFGAYHAIQSIPIVNLLLQAVLYTFWIPMFWLYIELRKRSCFVPIAAVLFVSLAACVVTPLFHARYALPMIYIAPLLVCLVFTKRGNQERETTLVIS